MQQLFGTQGPLRADERPRRAERIDVPEVQESTRVSFSQGIAVETGARSRSAAQPAAQSALGLYRAVQQL
jgi:hypothetical protein